jgi:hypothetical protein
LVALLFTVSVPVRLPLTVGRNVTVAVHEAPAAIDVPHVLVCEKSPETVTDDTVAATVPLFVTVTFCVALADPTLVDGNVNDVGLAASVAVLDCAPVPDSETVNVLFVALLETVSVPFCVPVAVGLKVTVAVQDAPAASEVPQVLVCVNWALVEIDEIDAAADPELEIVTFCVALEDPTTVDPYSSDVGLAASVAVGVALAM